MKLENSRVLLNYRNASLIKQHLMRSSARSQHTFWHNLKQRSELSINLKLYTVQTVGGSESWSHSKSLRPFWLTFHRFSTTTTYDGFNGVKTNPDTSVSLFVLSQPLPYKLYKGVPITCLGVISNVISSWLNICYQRSWSHARSSSLLLFVQLRCFHFVNSVLS